eukprot:4043852-Prymnesium_polylepis.1
MSSAKRADGQADVGTRVADVGVGETAPDERTSPSHPSGEPHCSASAAGVRVGGGRSSLAVRSMAAARAPLQLERSCQWQLGGGGSSG